MQMHSIIFSKGSYSTRRGPLSIILRSLCSESYFSCKRKHWRMKVLFPENDRSQTQFTRNRVSRGKLVKVAKLFAFYFRGYRYRFLVIIIVGTQHDVITRFPSHFYYSFSLRSAIFSSPSSSVSPIM